MSFFRSLLHPQSKAHSEAGVHYSHLIPRSVADKMLIQKKFQKISEKHVSLFMNKNQLDASQVQAILDESGISQKGYSILYKALAEKGASKRNKGSLLPKPMKVKSARHHVNSEVLEKLGSPIHIEATYVDKEREVVFNQHNNIFFDLETLQRYAVEFFEISTEECGGVLKFVLKLDECEILKNRKMERVTITLMNRALDPSITKDDKRHFSVQSENNILPLGSFEVRSKSSAFSKYYNWKEHLY